MSKNVFLGGEKNPHHHRSYMLHAGPRGTFFKVGVGGGGGYSICDQIEQSKWGVNSRGVQGRSPMKLRVFRHLIRVR